MAGENKKREEILDRYLDLPEDLQKALFSAQNSNTMFEIGKKHGLPVDKIGELADETGLVMLGMAKPSEYIKNLERRLGVEAIKAKEIAEEINQKIFSSIRESLKKIHGIGEQEKPKTVTPPGVTPTPPPTGFSSKKELPPLPVKTAPTQPLPTKIIMPEITETKLKEPVEEKIPSTSPILSGKIVEEEKPQTVPDVFIKKIPPNYTNGDPYKEPIK